MKTVNVPKKIKMRVSDAISLALCYNKDVEIAFFYQIAIENYPEKEKDSYHYNHLVFIFNAIMDRIERLCKIDLDNLKQNL